MPRPRKLRYPTGRDYLLHLVNDDLAPPEDRLKAGIALVAGEYRGLKKARAERAHEVAADNSPFAVPPPPIGRPS